MSAASALQFDLKPSLKLAGLLLVAHVFALGAAWVSLAGWALVLVGLGVLLSGAGCLAEALHRSSRAAVSLELREDGRASWRDRNGRWHEGRLANEHFVSTAFVVLRLDQTGRGRKWLVLMGDSARPEDLRRLRVWLRWRRELGSGGNPARAGTE
ncbi:MAG TPA: protein YgfX [Burkholderiales bacterium]|nr:protein YgfX [Burkholderiales bacterium]